MVYMAVCGMPMVLHIITGLNDGGAEGALFRLVTNDVSSNHVVVSLMDEGKYGPMLREFGIEVHALGFSGAKISLRGLKELIRIIKNNKPHVVQTWMYHADFIGGIFARFAGVREIFWGVRHSTFSKSGGVDTARIIARVNSILSYLIPKRIICVAHASVAAHVRQGYRKDKLVVIHNGYEFSRFPDKGDARPALRRELGIEDDFPLIGLVARFNGQKDHKNLVSALGKVQENSVPFHLVLVGRDVTWQNDELVQLLFAENIQSRTFLLGQRQDIPALMAGLDIHVLSSAYGEGFPNVIVEAMAAGTPCVSTDVGDAKIIIQNFGWIVEPSNPVMLGDAIEKALYEFVENRHLYMARSINGKASVTEAYSIEKMIERFHAVWFNEESEILELK